MNFILFYKYLCKLSILVPIIIIKQFWQGRQDNHLFLSSQETMSKKQEPPIQQIEQKQQSQDSDFYKKCTICQKKILNSKIHNHIKKHQKKKPKKNTYRVDYPFWGWNYSNRAARVPKKTKRRLKKNRFTIKRQNINPHQASQNKQIKTKMISKQASFRREKRMIQRNKQVQQMEGGITVGKYKLKQRKIKPNLRQIQSDSNQEQSQSKNQSEKRKNSQSENIKQAQNKKQIQPSVNEMKFKLNRNKEYTAKLQQQLINLRNENKKIVRSYEQKIQHLNEVIQMMDCVSANNQWKQKQKQKPYTVNVSVNTDAQFLSFVPQEEYKNNFVVTKQIKKQNESKQQMISYQQSNEKRISKVQQNEKQLQLEQLNMKQIQTKKQNKDLNQNV